eukprot:Opistho-1_new@33399
MCCGRPISCASSPIVRKASGFLSIAPLSGPMLMSSPVDDPGAQHLAGTERQHPAWRDRHLDTGLGVAADTLALVAQDEAAKARNLHILALGERFAHMAENLFDHPGCVRAG